MGELVYTTDLGVLYHGDTFEIMEQLAIAEMKVDMIFADLPYGQTRNKWDSELDLEELWKHYKNLTTEKTPIVFTAQQPFTSTLVVSNIENYRDEWIWKKSYVTGHLNAKKKPMRNHESVLVFYEKLPTYNPQFTEGEPYKSVATGEKGSKNYGKQSAYTIDNPGIRYPRTVQEWSKAKGKYHRTQKPVSMFEYFIKTYTNEGDLVLDNVSGSGTTAIACENTNRRWICIEREKEFIDITIKRLEELKVDKEY